MVTIICSLLLIFALGGQAAKTITKVDFVPNTNLWGQTNNGMVRVLLKEGATESWSLVCMAGITMKIAGVFCYEMGYGNVAAPIITTFTSDLKIGVRDVICTAVTQPSDYQLSKCSYTTITGSATSVTCSSKPLSVICTSNKRPGVVTTVAPDMATLPPVNCAATPIVRLIDGTSTSGTVEINYNGTWGSICNTGFYENAAKVICSMACKQSQFAKAVTGNFTGSKGPILLSDLNCPVNSTHINNCTHSGWRSVKSTCTHRMDARVECSPRTIVTPRIPTPDVLCSGARAYVYFNKTINTDLTVALLSLVNPSSSTASACNFISSDNGTYVIASFNFDQCGGTVDTKDATFTSYTNLLLRMYKPVGNLIYNTNYTIPVVCKVPKADKGDNGNIGASKVTVPPKIGEDKLQIKVTLYSDAAFKNSIKNGGAIRLGTRIYVKVKQEKVIKNNQMAVRNCWATQNADRTSNPRKDLIKNACPQAGISNLVGISSMEQSFSFLAFVFNSGATPKLYVHCDTNTCHNTDTSVACSRTCSSARRRKRSVGNVAPEIITYVQSSVDGGPFYITGPTGASSIITSSFVLVGMAMLLRLL